MRINNAKIAAGFLVLASAALFWSLRAEKTANAGEKKTVKPAFVLGKPFTVEIGKTAFIPAQKLRVGFERVTEDSRCPKDVDCVWAGQIGVEIGLKKADKTLGAANLIVQGNRYVTPKSVGKIGAYYVKLIEVAPEKGAPNDPTSVQRATLIVQNKPFDAPKDGK